MVNEERRALLARRASALPRDPRRTRLAPLLARLGEELAARGLPRIPTWLGIDWFAPDGVLGFAVPFHLASQALLEEERRRNGPAEDAQPRQCMRFLRHEAAHALESAFRLARSREHRDPFGHRSQPYRSSYRVDPWSREFVVNLPRWYAQSHPYEDFAETFAVWLDPRSAWRRRYADRPGALAKLRAVDRLMGELRGATPDVDEFDPAEAVWQREGDLEALFGERERLFRSEERPPYEPALRRSFRTGASSPLRAPAARILRELGPSVSRAVTKECEISAESFGILWTMVRRHARILQLGELRIAAPQARRELARACVRSMFALKRGGWEISR